MATLEDKLLGEKTHYYCDSSDDEGGRNSGGDSGDEQGACAPKAPTIVAPPTNEVPDMTHWSGNSANTGPKGVIKDWQRFKQLETEKKNESERERCELMKKLSITAKTSAEDQKAKEQAEFDEELNELLNDDFLQQFQKRRMQEMLAMSGVTPKFGEVISLKNGDDFLTSIDNEHKSVTVIIHIYEDKYRACKSMNKCIIKLAKEYPSVKFCKILSTVAGLSKNFKTVALPTLIIYKNGQVIGNFIRLGDEFGEEFYSSDVEGYLIEHGLLQDKSMLPTIASSSALQDDDE
ncbi:unnamed protein product [Diamesa hyperborea]